MTILLLMLCFGAGVGDPGGTGLLVEHHLRRYPLMQVQDVYKLLYQGEFGVGHFLGDGEYARKYLLEELAAMDSADRGEELLEPVSSDGRMVRVNLRPYVRLGYGPETLIKAMMASAAETHGDTTRFVATWREFMASAARSAFSPHDLREWDARIRRGEFRVVHHSATYGEVYRPAYRVCRRNDIEALLADRGRP